MLYTLTEANPVTEDIQHLGGSIQIMVSGTFAGETVNLEVSQENLPFLILTDFAATTPVIYTVNVHALATYRLAALGAISTTDLKVSVLTA